MLLRKKMEMGSSIFIQVQFIVTPENRSKVELFESHWIAEPGVDQVVSRHERTHAGQTTSIRTGKSCGNLASTCGRAL